MKRWLRDTLFLRLFLLMWAALVVSHLAAFGIVTGGWFGTRPGGGAFAFPIFPSLPPTPGIPDALRERLRRGDGGEGAAARDGRDGRDGRDRRDQRDNGPGDDGFGRPPLPDAPRPAEATLPRRAAAAGEGSASPSLPTTLLVVDYLVRLVVIGAAAALGARWLATPVRRLVEASRGLGQSLGAGRTPALLDERAGTVEVREAAQVYNRMAAELAAQFESRGMLMAALSHDLRTPLTRMRMRLELADDPAAAARSIADIRAMDELLDTSLAAFRDASAQEPVQTVDIAALLQSSVDDLVEVGHDVAFAASQAVLASARPGALRRVIDNLLGNAVRYGGGRVVVGLDVLVDERVRVRIDDDGPGIPPAALTAVFQPFYRGDAARGRATGGSGLGLYIARDLLRRQGGDVTLANRDGGGLRVEFVLPRPTAAA